eukprot:23744_5
MTFLKLVFLLQFSLIDRKNKICHTRVPIGFHLFGRPPSGPFRYPYSRLRHDWRYFLCVRSGGKTDLIVAPVYNPMKTTKTGLVYKLKILYLV